MEVTVKKPQEADLPAASEVDEERQPTPEEQERMARLVKVIAAYEKGTLTFAQFSKLNASAQRAYTAKFGRPKNPDQQRSEKRAVTKRRKAKKIARASTRRNSR